MKNVLLTGMLVCGLPAIADAQNDLQKIGQFLQGLQEMQEDGGQDDGFQNGQPQTLPYKAGGPNSSGNQNQGNFQPNNFFGPQNGMTPGQGQGRVTYPNGTYPNGTYPNGTYQNGNFQNGTYPNGMHPNGTYPGNGRTVYPDPPGGPPRVYSQLPIVIRCSPNAPGVCDYRLITDKGSSFPYKIGPGQTQNLTESTDWSVSYTPAPGMPTKTYRLRGGKAYEIRKLDGSWQLYMVP